MSDNDNAKREAATMNDNDNAKREAATMNDNDNGNTAKKHTAELNETLKKHLFKNEAVAMNGTVIKITGDWGTGKTHFWHDFTKRNSRQEWWRLIGRPTFIYISLFNKKSVDDINANILLQLNNRKLKRVIKLIPPFKIYGIPISASAILSSLSKEEFIDVIVCIDDFERLSSSLCPHDILGLIAQLKEEKNYRVVMLLNQSEVGKQGHLRSRSSSQAMAEQEEATNKTATAAQEALALYSEKVVDYQFRFSPTTAESFAVAKEMLSQGDASNNIDPETDKLLIEFLQECSINNIRIIVQVIRLVDRLSPILKGVEDSTDDDSVSGRGSTDSIQSATLLRGVSYLLINTISGEPAMLGTLRSVADKCLADLEERLRKAQERHSSDKNSYEYNARLIRGMAERLFGRSPADETASGALEWFDRLGIEAILPSVIEYVRQRTEIDNPEIEKCCSRIRENIHKVEALRHEWSDDPDGDAIELKSRTVPYHRDILAITQAINSDLVQLNRMVHPSKSHHFDTPQPPRSLSLSETMEWYKAWTSKDNYDKDIDKFHQDYRRDVDDAHTSQKALVDLERTIANLKSQSIFSEALVHGANPHGASLFIHDIDGANDNSDIATLKSVYHANSAFLKTSWENALQIDEMLVSLIRHPLANTAEAMQHQRKVAEHLKLILGRQELKQRYQRKVDEILYNATANKAELYEELVRTANRDLATHPENIFFIADTFANLKGIPSSIADAVPTPSDMVAKGVAAFVQKLFDDARERYGDDLYCHTRLEREVSDNRYLQERFLTLEECIEAYPSVGRVVLEERDANAVRIEKRVTANPTAIIEELLGVGGASTLSESCIAVILQYITVRQIQDAIRTSAKAVAGIDANKALGSSEYADFYKRVHKALEGLKSDKDVNVQLTAEVLLQGM